VVLRSDQPAPPPPTTARRACSSAAPAPPPKRSRSPKRSAASWCRWARPAPRRWRWCSARRNLPPLGRPVRMGQLRPGRGRPRARPALLADRRQRAALQQPRHLPARPADLPAEWAERVLARRWPR
jgi:hypothetical protein